MKLKKEQKSKEFFKGSEGFGLSKSFNETEEYLKSYLGFSTISKFCEGGNLKRYKGRKSSDLIFFVPRDISFSELAVYWEHVENNNKSQRNKAKKMFLTLFQNGFIPLSSISEDRQREILKCV